MKTNFSFLRKKVRAYHYFDFNGAGQIHEIGDFFDASGVMNAAMASN